MSFWKRRLRIESDSAAGHMAQVKDIDNGGRVVPGVAQIRIDIVPRDSTTAHLLMYQYDEQGRIVFKDGDALMETRTIADVSVNLLAMEPLKRAEIEQMFKDALQSDAIHHKQWSLWEIAEALHLNLNFDDDEDIPERGIAP